MSVLDRLANLHTPKVQAAPATIVPTAPRVAHATGWGTGMERLALFEFTPPEGLWSREAAMSVPTISRARNLLCSAIGALPLVLYTVDWGNPARPVERALQPAGWMGRPDPDRTRNWSLSWLADDLMFYGRGYWRVVERYAPPQAYPRSFQWMPAAEVRVDAEGTTLWRNSTVDPGDVVEFLSPIDGLLYTGWRAINTAMQLDQAAERFSRCEVPAGWLKQTDGEPMSGEELNAMAAMFAGLRRSLSVAALNTVTDYHESSLDPSRLQLVEARQYQSLELARLANIPPSLVGAPTGTGMTYSNTLQAKQDLIDFGAVPYIGAIEQTLSGPNVLPAGQFTRLDLSAFLRNPFTPNDNAGATDMEQAFNPAATPPPTPAPTPAATEEVPV